MTFLTTLQDIESFLQSQPYTVLLFMDPLCVDCQRIHPALNELEEAIKPHTIAAVWRKDVPLFIQHYSVFGVPSVLVYHHGEEIARWVDRHPKSIEALRQFIQSHCPKEGSYAGIISS